MTWNTNFSEDFWIGKLRAMLKIRWNRIITNENQNNGSWNNYNELMGLCWKGKKKAENIVGRKTRCRPENPEDEHCFYFICFILYFVHSFVQFLFCFVLFNFNDRKFCMRIIALILFIVFNQNSLSSYHTKIYLFWNEL